MAKNCQLYMAENLSVKRGLLILASERWHANPSTELAHRLMLKGRLPLARILPLLDIDTASPADLLALADRTRNWSSWTAPHNPDRAEQIATAASDLERLATGWRPDAGFLADKPLVRDATIQPVSGGHVIIGINGHSRWLALAFVVSKSAGWALCRAGWLRVEWSNKP